MKRIFIISSLAIIILAAISCEEETLPTPDVELTPVYSIVVNDSAWTDEDVFGWDVYKEKPLMIVFKSEKKLLAKAYEISGFTDNSTATNYDFLYKAHIEAKTANDEDTLITKDYSVFGSKIDTTATVTIKEQQVVDENLVNVENSYSVNLSEKEVYN